MGDSLPYAACTLSSQHLFCVLFTFFLFKNREFHAIMFHLGYLLPAYLGTGILPASNQHLLRSYLITFC